MPDLPPTHLVITLSAEPQDGRDLYSEHRLVCAGCGRGQKQVMFWILPGLCNDCAMRVSAATVAAPAVRPVTQPPLFPNAHGRMPG